MDWMSLAKQSKQHVPTSHCSRPRLLPQRFQTQRQACGPCRMCMSVRVCKRQFKLLSCLAGCTPEAKPHNAGRDHFQWQQLQTQARNVNLALRCAAPVIPQKTRSAHMHYQQRCDSAGLLLWLRLAFASSSAWSCWVRGCRQGCTHSATQAQQENTV